MRTRSIALLSVLAACLAAPAEGAKLKVPGDHATIQAAVNAALAGDVIEVSSGTYGETVLMFGTDNLTLRAKKGHVVTIDASSSATPLSVGLANGITVRDIRLRNAIWAGLDVVGVDGMLITGCTVDGSTSGGIRVYGSSGEVVIEKCIVKNTTDGGIYLDADKCVVRDSVVRNAGGDGIVVEGGTANTIEGNRIENVGGTGIQVGVYPTPCESCLVADNRIKGAWDGIVVDDSSTENSIFDNTIKKTDYDGIDLEDGADDNIVSGNSIQGTVDTGVECDSNDCLVCMNQVKGSWNGIWIEDGAYQCLFFKNKVKQSKDDGFEVDGTSNTLVGNWAKKSAAYDLNDDTAPGTNTYLSNTFGTVAP